MKTIMDWAEQKRKLDKWKETMNNFHGAQATLDNVSDLIEKVLKIAGGDHSVLIPLVESKSLMVKTEYGPLIIDNNDNFLSIEYSEEFKQNEELIVNQIKEIEEYVATSVKALWRGEEDTSSSIDVTGILYRDCIAFREFLRELTRKKEDSVEKDS